MIKRKVMHDKGHHEGHTKATRNDLPGIGGKFTYPIITRRNKALIQMIDAWRMAKSMDSSTGYFRSPVKHPKIGVNE
jgi:hypothetical protein